MQARLDRLPDAMRIRRRTVEHVFGTIKDWMGRSHFKTRTLEKVSAEMSLHVLAYNLKRTINLLGATKRSRDAGLRPKVLCLSVRQAENTFSHSLHPKETLERTLTRFIFGISTVDS